MQMDLEELISSAAGIPASHLAMPGSETARKMTVTSGRKCAVLSRHSGQLGSLVKMLLGTSAWASTMCWLTWTDSATPRKRLLFRLVPLEHPTDETEFGLLHTPTKILGNNQRAWPSTMKQKNTTRSIFGFFANAERFRQSGSGASGKSEHHASIEHREADQSFDAVGWPTEPAICGADDGLPSGMVRHRLQALGNAVVPQIPEMIGRAILKSMEAA